MFNGFLFMLSRLGRFSGVLCCERLFGWIRGGCLTFDSGKVCFYTEGKATGCERSLRDKEDGRDVGKNAFRRVRDMEGFAIR